MSWSFSLFFQHIRECKDCPNFKMGGFDETFCTITGCSKSENSTCDTSGKKYGKADNPKQPQASITEINDLPEDSIDDLIKRCRCKLTELYAQNDKVCGDETIINTTEWTESLTNDLCSLKGNRCHKESNLQVGDYVEGYEPYGTKLVYTRGTIKNIQYNEDGSIKRCEIQCDDTYNGFRGNSLSVYYPIKKIEQLKFCKKHV